MRIKEEFIFNNSVVSKAKLKILLLPILLDNFFKKIFEMNYFSLYIDYIVIV